MSTFAEAISQSPQPLRPMLRATCALYALSYINDNMGWYLTFNYFTPNKSKAIWEEINTLCSTLRPHVLDLVNAFEIPDDLLDAPIASKDYISAFAYPKNPGEEFLRAHL